MAAVGLGRPECLRLGPRHTSLTHQGECSLWCSPAVSYSAHPQFPVGGCGGEGPVLCSGTLAHSPSKRKEEWRTIKQQGKQQQSKRHLRAKQKPAPAPQPRQALVLGSRLAHLRAPTSSKRLRHPVKQPHPPVKQLHHPVKHLRRPVHPKPR